MIGIGPQEILVLAGLAVVAAVIILIVIISNSKRP